MQLALAVRCIRQCAGIMFTLGEQVALSASNTMLHRSRSCEMNSLLPREILRLFDQQHIIYWTVTVKSSSISSIKILIFGSIHCTIHSARRKKKLSSSIIEITIHEIRVYFFISSVFLLSRITRITIAKNSMRDEREEKICKKTRLVQRWNHPSHRIRDRSTRDESCATTEGDGTRVPLCKVGVVNLRGVEERKRPSCERTRDSSTVLYYAISILRFSLCECGGVKLGYPTVVCPPLSPFFLFRFLFLLRFLFLSRRLQFFSNAWAFVSQKDVRDLIRFLLSSRFADPSLVCRGAYIRKCTSRRG